MSRREISFPSELHEELKVVRTHWEEFALKVLNRNPIHPAPTNLLVYDLETTKEFEPKFHGFLNYDVIKGQVTRYGLIPHRFTEDVSDYLNHNNEWLETYEGQKQWAEVLDVLYPAPEGFAVLIGLNLLYFDLKQSDLMVGHVQEWDVADKEYTYVHQGKPLKYRRINASYSGKHFLYYNFDLLPIATKVGFKTGEKKAEHLASEMNKHFHKLPNPPTFLKPALSVQEIEYCINDCLVELELFSHLYARIIE